MEFDFRKSSHSGGGSGTCVEVASNVPGVRAVRDSKEPEGAHLTFGGDRFGYFLAALKSGQLDRE